MKRATRRLADEFVDRHVSTHVMSLQPNRSTAMFYLQQEQLARAQCRAQVREAAHRRLVRALRAERRAERAVHQARRAAARAALTGA